MALSSFQVMQAQTWWLCHIVVRSQGGWSVVTLHWDLLPSPESKLLMTSWVIGVTDSVSLNMSVNSLCTLGSLPTGYATIEQNARILLTYMGEPGSRTQVLETVVLAWPICTALWQCTQPLCYVHCPDAMCTALMLCALSYAVHTASCCAHCLLLCSQPLAMLLLVYIPVVCSLKSPVYSLWTSDKYFCSIYRLIQFTHFGLQTSLCLPVLTGYGPRLLEVSSLFFTVSPLHLSPSAALFCSYSVCDLCN